MQLKTKHKIQLASLAYYPIHRWRSLIGKTDCGHFKRRGLNWELNLGEVVDFMIYLSGGFESYLSRFILNNLQDGAIAMDIGANVGAHTLAMGKAVGPNGQAHAVEATEYAFRKLKRNIELNPGISGRIHEHHCMLVSSGSNSEGELGQKHIYSSWPFSSKDPRHPTHQGVSKNVGTARTLSLDKLIEELRCKRLDLVKIDVDGNEWNVLSGGEQTLRNFTPLVIIEVALDYNERSAAKGFANVHNFLMDLGYTLFTFKGQKLSNDLEELVRIVPPGTSMNVVAVPKSGAGPNF